MAGLSGNEVEEVLGIHSSPLNWPIGSGREFAGVIAAALAILREQHGRSPVVIDVCDMPIKCPVAPLEFLMLADWYFHERGMAIIKRGAPINLIHDLPVVDTFIRAKSSITNEEMHKFDELKKQIDQQMGQLDAEYRS